jgi:hypothetical protein
MIGEREDWSGRIIQMRFPFANQIFIVIEPVAGAAV